MTDFLLHKHCVPCEGGVPVLTADQIERMLGEIPDWEVTDDEPNKIVRTFKFKTFVAAIEFINAVAELAESENHHPDFTINYSKVTLTLWTHAIGGLSENDFIMAAKINHLPESTATKKE